ncbi:MAG: hypothetical protein HY721_20795 [Planctomycetes bacterium]|nr:hypothetical protein [Planctomycetota bacterium]
MRPRTLSRLALAAASVLWAPAAGISQEAEPPFERLLELNSRELFGGETTVKGDRVTVRYPGKGLFGQGFRSGGGKGRGFVSDLEEIKDPDMKKRVSQEMEPAFSFAGIDGGEALSRFEIADDFKVSFRIRAPLVPPGASLVLRVNEQDPRTFIQTSLFQSLTVSPGGKPKTKAASDKRFHGPPSAWLVPRNAPALPVEVVFKDRKLSVFVSLFAEKDKPERIEVLSEEGIEKPTSGRLRIKFSKLTFGVADFVVDGKLHRAWAEAELAKLRKEGKLKLKPEEVVARKDEKRDRHDKGHDKGREGGREKGREKGAGPRPKAPPEDAKKPAKPKRGPVNVNDPDPEADVEL